MVSLATHTAMDQCTVKQGIVESGEEGVFSFCAVERGRGTEIGAARDTIIAYIFVYCVIKFAYTDSSKWAKHPGSSCGAEGAEER